MIEIECRTDELPGILADRKKTGSDFSEGMIEEAQKQFPSTEFICSPAEGIRINEKIDVIRSEETVCYKK